MSLTDLFYRSSRGNHGREKSHSCEIRKESGEQSGAVCHQRGCHQHFSCFFANIGNGGSDQSKNNQRDDETQELAEYSVESNKQPNKFALQYISKSDAQCDGDDDAGQ